MTPDFRNALAAGTERVSGWADLLDRINVFPVPDGDTGRNLSVSLAPLRRVDGDAGETVRQLLTAACGNSGNIAARFFSEFLPGLERDGRLWAGGEAARQGAAAARRAVVNPRPGTMLTVFDDLAEALAQNSKPEGNGFDGVVGHLEASVRSTTAMLPELSDAGVVDAGALGMFIWLEGFFHRLSGAGGRLIPVGRRFADCLTVAASFRPPKDPGQCVDAVVRLNRRDADVTHSLSDCADSVVIAPDGERVKLHFHARPGGGESVRRRIATLGTVERWSEETMAPQTERFLSRTETPVHIMTDAAGSVTREDARRYGFTLLDSQILIENRSIPETALDPETLYAAMKNGVKVATAQASDFERHQHYESAIGRSEKALYLCVGSAYTGNVGAATAWKAENDPQDRLMVLDTGAASGRLGMMVLETARYAEGAPDFESVGRFARDVLHRGEEFIFLDRLRYLAAGGRLGKSRALFGDLLRMKPVISPCPEGVRKAGVVRDRKGQLDFALDRLREAFSPKDSPMIMLEYADNRQWVETVVAARVQKALPAAEILVQPLSLTSGAHMGPGTWGVAFLRKTSETDGR